MTLPVAAELPLSCDARSVEPNIGRISVTGSASDRTELWLSLLRTLTAEFPRFAVWKNAASAFAGTGDLDALASRQDWPAIEQRFLTWSRRRGFGPVVICRHVPSGPHLLAVANDSDYLVHLDISTRGTFRGSTLVDVRKLQQLTEMDEQGYRRIRPGAEGIFKLCMNGTRRGGRPNHEALEIKNVAPLLASDPEGVRMASHLLGPMSAAARRGAAAVVEGGWDRAAMRQVEAWSLLRGLAEPQVAAGRLWVNHWAAKRCPVIRLVKENNRRLPDDREGWIAEVTSDHEVIDLR